MTRTMQEVRAECAQLGITPGRSIEECERRILDKRIENEKAAPAPQPGTPTGRFASSQPEMQTINPLVPEYTKSNFALTDLSALEARIVHHAAQCDCAMGGAGYGPLCASCRPKQAAKPRSKALRHKQLRTHTKRRQRAKGQMAQASKKLRKAKQRVESQIHAMRGKFRHGRPDALRNV